MSSPEAVVPLPIARPRQFSPHHRWDHNFILAYALLIWLGILMGFGGDIIKHLESNAAPYPFIVHVHAAAFVGWLALFTLQIWLVRIHHSSTHRKLGKAVVVLAILMVILGPATAIIVQRARFGTPSSDPAFLSIQLTDIVAFAALVSAALLWRKQPAAHKRLMLLATLYISDAGFSRWLGGTVEAHVGDGFWGTVAQLYLANDLLIIGLGVYDLITRRRLHVMYVAGVVWIAAIQFTSITLYLNPLWKPIATKLLGH